MHYFFIVAIIVIIVFLQIHSYRDTRKKIKGFSEIFPDSSDNYELTKESKIQQISLAKKDELVIMLKENGFDSDAYHYIQHNANGNEISCFREKKAKKDLINSLSTTSNGISIIDENVTLKSIIDPINDYLENNKTVSDFHLMKDIVDRNCDAKEEEINAQIPFPLYLGLVGTMLGILIGILILWGSGGIGELLNTNNVASADGIEALLGGVGIAMIASALGIIFTTRSSHEFKTAKSNLDSHKHTFLSWIQAKLLPTLSDNVVGAIREMTANLTEFNETFSSNISSLDDALSKVNESHRLQVQLLNTVKQIADKDLSQQNILLYNALKNSATEIGTLAKYLQNTNEYLAHVRSLNENLELQENRTRLIEEVGVFFKKEIEEIELRKGVISIAVGKVDDYLKQALDRLKENADAQLTGWNITAVKQQETLQEAVSTIDNHLMQALEKMKQNVDSQLDEWQKSIMIRQDSSSDEGLMVSELQRLTLALKNMKNIEEVTKEQNHKIGELADAIKELIAAKDTPLTMPLWAKIALITGGSVVSIACLTYIIPLFVQWITNLNLLGR